MDDAVPGATLALGALCFGCFVWGTVRHFARDGAGSWGAWGISALSVLGFASFVRHAPRDDAGRDILASLAFVIAMLLWRWTVATTRTCPPTLAYTDDQPRMLLNSGPYAWIRHPFYGAYLLFWFGAAVASGGVLWPVFAVMALVYNRAARFEERKFANSGLATAYAAYRATTGGLIPSLRLRSPAPNPVAAVMQLTRVCGLSHALGSVKRAIATERMAGPHGISANEAHRGDRVRLSLMTGLIGMMRAFATGTTLQGLPAAIAGQIRAEQVNALSTLIGVMSLMGLGTVPLILYDFLTMANAMYLLPMCGLIVALYLVLSVLSIGWNWGWRGLADDAARARDRFVAVCFVLGVAWGVLFVMLMSHAHDDRRGLLYALIIGLMSAGVLVSPPSAAFAFWLPVTLAGLVSVTLVSATGDITEALLLSGYAALTLFCILYLNRALIRRALGEIEQHEGRETIGLLLRDFEESACDWLWETDQAGCLTYVSQRFAHAARLDPERLLGRELVSFLHAQDRGIAEPARRITDRPSLSSLMQRRLPFRDVEVSLHVGGDSVWWSLTGKPKFSARQEFEGYRGVGSDVTQARRANDRARFLAHYDELTGLANRRLFREVVEARAQKGVGIALLCLDLDRFKAVNDTHGHPTGDALLIAVSRRLQAQIGPADMCARLGGDEFAIVVEDSAPAAVGALAARLVDELGRPYQLGDLQVEIGTSIGAAIAPPEEATSLAILRAADAALYQAKADGRGTVRFYDSELSARDVRRRAMQADLRGALNRGELSLDFQPIFNLAKGRVSTVEALVRWDRHALGTLHAGDFVPLAESCGLIDDLGEWVLAAACEQALELPPHVRLAVNVSPLQLRGTRFITHLRAVLERTGLEPGRLELELTETAFFDMSEETLELLQDVRRTGVRINLDDFGVGHTSLGQLRRFPFSTLKIDRSFVQDLPGNSSARVIVRGLASMAAELGIRTTAEGIETPEQLDLVRAAGCGDVQGFLLARPMPMASLLRMIQAPPSPSIRSPDAGPAAPRPEDIFGHAEMFT